MTEPATDLANAALPSAYRSWWIGFLLASNAILFWLGLTEDAITVGKTLKAEFLGFVFRVVDQRQTFSVLSAIFKLRSEGNHFLFAVLLLFSVFFPLAKLAGNALIWGAFLKAGRAADGWMHRGARVLHGLGKWSMLEVFVAGMLCVLLKLGDVSRFKIEAGMYWFFAAVLLSLVNAKLTERILEEGGRSRKDWGGTVGKYT